MRYTSFDAAVVVIGRLGQEVLLATSNIKSAFRLLPAHSDDFNLLDFTFDSACYYDKVLPMGCFTSCAAFERFRTFWV